MLGITDSQWYEGIADKIRTHMSSFQKSKPSELPQAVDDLFFFGTQMGQEAGFQGGYDFGLEIGKQTEYDRFWDNAQDFGNRNVYTNAFGGGLWNDETFKPKYDIVPTDSLAMFELTDIVDLVGVLEKQGVTLDFSNSTRSTNMFDYAKTKYIGIVDTRSMADLNRTFSRSAVVSIQGLILRDDGSQTFSNILQSCPYLEHMPVEGVIGKNGFNVSSSKKLDKESNESIVNCLSTITTGLTVTMSLDAVNKAFETYSGGNDGSASQEWKDLVSTRQNWTIVLG